MMLTFRACMAALVVFIVGFVAAADPSTGWRYDGTGRFPSATPPQEWSSSKNVLWKVSLPGSSYAAPVVAGDNLFVVSDPSEILCVRRSDGKVLWKKDHADLKAPAGGKGGFGKGGFGKGGFGKGKGGGGFGKGGGSMRGGAGNTAATPATDGTHVAVVLGNGIVAVYTKDGKRLWGKYIESAPIGFGPSASPLLIDGKVIVHLKDLVAFDVATGKEAWRVPLTAVHASPVSARIGKETVVISPAGAIVRAKDGKVLAKGKFRASQSSPVVEGEILCVSSSRSIEAFKLTQTKDDEVTVTSLWSEEGSGDRHHCPSAVVYEGMLYGVSNGGMLRVVELKTGKKVYNQRLPLGEVYSSVAMAGGLLYVLGLRGKAVVFKPGNKFERVALNQLEGTGSCPVFAGDHLYVRGTKNLYCVSAKAKKDGE